MSKKQTRRSISVSGDTYDRLKAHCDEHQLSMSGVVEVQICRFLGIAGPEPRQKPASASRRWDRLVAPTPAPTRVEQIRESMARQEPPKAKEVTITTPVLEKNGNWEKKAAPVEPAEKKPGVPLDDLASKIFTF